MYKELSICIIIVVVIFSLDLYTQNHTKKSVSIINEQLMELKDTISKGNKDNMIKKANELNSNWKKSHDRLAYYIEHDELEKVDTAIVTMISYIENADYSSALADLDKGKFVLEHIQDKYAFNIQNIF